MKKVTLLRVMICVCVIVLLCVVCCFAYADESKPYMNNCIGSNLVFGHYDQSYRDSQEPIEWIILDQQDNHLLLLSATPLDYQQYSKKKEQSWETSSIREWLNDEFIKKAFDEDELKAILETKNTTGGEVTDSDWDEIDDIVTTEKVFLLSSSEYKKYIKSDEIKINNYVNNAGAKRKMFGKDETWWLRSSAKKKSEAYYVGHGKVESGRVLDWRCIRPAMWIDINAFDWEHSKFVKGKKARQLAKDGQYMEAVAITDTLGKYWDSEMLSAQYITDYATIPFDDGDYTEAIIRYEQAKKKIEEMFSEVEYRAVVVSTWLKLYDKLLESRYQVACQKKNDGDYLAAIELFTQVGQYKDSMNMLCECFDKTHIQYSWLTRKIGSTVNAGLDTGFSKKDALEEKDPHYGWSLGRFMISGYEEIKVEDSRTVFYKSPDNSITLWFVLEQDINALDGNEKLLINYDGNGYDAEFQYKKTEFGRGALLVKYIDSRNYDSDVVLYKDYLASHEDRGADTSVKINKEGIYEVALDYEIFQLRLFRNCNNYRIYTTFEVRNSNGV